MVSDTDGNSIRGSFLEHCRSSAAFEAAPDLLADFAERYVRRSPSDYLASVDPDQFCAQVADIFAFAAVRPRDESAVRVFNPTLATHGYEPGGAVVQVAAGDVPFLIDSVSNEIQAGDLDVQWKIHPVIGVERDDGGALTAIVTARTASHRDSIQHYELQRTLDDDELAALTESVHSVLHSVRSAVTDFEEMQGAIYRMIRVAKAGAARYERGEIDEAVAFLEWLLDDNFVFLGYREYSIEDTPEGEAISVVPGSGLGILRRDTDSKYARPTPLKTLSEGFRQRMADGHLLVLTKTNSLSPVHRRAKMDYIGVRHNGPDGRVAGEARLLGMFTGKAYMAMADTIPILRRKLEQILDAEDTITGSHYYKQIVQIFNSFPKDELFASPIDGIAASVVGLIEAQEQEGVRLFVQRDLLERKVSVLVVLRRDRFNAVLRKNLQAYFMDRFNGQSVDYHLSLGETDTARIHFTVWVAEGRVPEVSFEELEAGVISRTRSWDERVGDRLVEQLGVDRGGVLAATWPERFPDYYHHFLSLDLVVGDILRLDELRTGTAGDVVGLQNQLPDPEGLTRLAVYRRAPKLELSAIMPTLEDLGLRVIEEVPTRLTSKDGDYFIHDFGVLDRFGSILDLDAVADRMAAAIRAVLEGSCESDSLNRLVLTSGLDHLQVRILRAYRTYRQRVGSGFTVEYLNDAFVAHPLIARDLVRLFEARFDPAGDPVAAGPIRETLLSSLEQVASLDEDRILRGVLALIDATQRTNAYRPGATSLSLKFRSGDVPEMPLPAPLFEIFVFGDDVEGIHLRGGRVARGGIRWSTRKEDYRTEVLGLMKAQMTKNAVIVPTGAKGGFVLRSPPTDRGALKEAVKSAYRTFIRGLLDLTDNLVDEKVVPPPNVVVLDEDDQYFVVAADKGTATFSDTANQIAAEYEFWLGDAFASGGSAGYDHKALGITARGAWESVKWHFHELGVDFATGPISVAGIGDMSGDVFGNGVLASKQLKLVAAFDHRHIFIDPDPDPAVSWSERHRLYEGLDSTWASYDPGLISAGGGVYERSAKSIALSVEARSVLGVADENLTPAEVIQGILLAPVDLLWNGGIGTFVKASSQVHEEVDDRSNDAVRVDARDLRCRVVAEGGNLGFTQEGRVEFARNGGRINTDFIDNSGGVNCSDREVNLKILLGLAEDRGELDREGRDELVQAVVGDVVERILYDSFLQAQILAQEVDDSGRRMEVYEELMTVLEGAGILDRDLEALPSTDDITERSRLGQGLTSPELAVLVTYSKRSIRDWLLESDLPDSPEFDDDLRRYFPEDVVDRFGHLLRAHPLRRDLVATIVANEIVNSQGIAFVTRLMAETGGSPARIVTAYRTARAVTNAPARWVAVEGLFGVISPDMSRNLLAGVDDLVEDVTRWYLRHPAAQHEPSETADAFSELAEIIVEVGPPSWRQERKRIALDLSDLGVPENVAQRHAFQDDLRHAPAMIEVAAGTGRPLREVAEAFLLIGSSFEIDWLEEQLAAYAASTRWHRRAVQVIEDDLTLLQRELAEKVLAEAPDMAGRAAVQAYRHARTQALDRLSRFMRSLPVEGVDDVSPVVVAIRRIQALAGGEPDPTSTP